jgi:hypothetical protein
MPETLLPSIYIALALSVVLIVYSFRLRTLSRAQVEKATVALPMVFGWVFLAAAVLTLVTSIWLRQQSCSSAACEKLRESERMVSGKTAESKSFGWLSLCRESPVMNQEKLTQSNRLRNLRQNHLDRMRRARRRSLGWRG